MIEEELPPLVLDSTEAFFRALRAPDLGTVLSVLQAVSSNPEAALAFGKWDDVDVIDELVHQSFQREGISFLEVLMATLAVFDDPRVVERFVKALHASAAPSILSIVVARLSHEPVASFENSVRPLLMQEQSREHARAAADLLLPSRSLLPEQRLRMTVANSEGLDMGPEFTRDQTNLWIAEMAGWYGTQARAVLQNRPEDVFEILAPHWTDLDGESKSWLMDLGVSRSPLDTMPVLRRALEDSDPSVVMRALALIQSLDGGRAMFAGAMAPLLHHAQPRVRILALQAGARHEDWRSLLESEQDPDVRGWVARRLAEKEGVAGADDLEPLLSHRDWRVRAGVTAAFVRLGPDAIPILRRHALAEDKAERVAAVQALVELNDYVWLEENLVSDEPNGASENRN